MCNAQFSEEGKEWRFPKAQAEGRLEDQEHEKDEEEAPNAGEAGKNAQTTALITSVSKKPPPEKGVALQCAMVEESVPGGIEWVAGLVLSVNMGKKTLKVRVTSGKDEWSRLSLSSSSSPLICPPLHERFDL